MVSQAYVRERKLRVAAQPSTVPSMYAVQEACRESSIAQVGTIERKRAAEQSGTASHDRVSHNRANHNRSSECRAAEVAEWPARGKTVSHDAGREQAVAII